MSLLSLIFFLFAIACRPLAARTFEGGRLTSALYNLEKLLKQQHKEAQFENLGELVKNTIFVA